MESKTMLRRQASKTCQNCKDKFTIEAGDFEFYKKIDVPEPTFCPECRLQRRMSFRNELNLYKRKCNATDKDIITIYHLSSPVKVYDRDYWWSDKWDVMEYGQDYDFNKPLFEQFKKLFLNVPHPAIGNDDTVVNSPYCNSTFNAKNCYLTSNSIEVENVLYSNRLANCKDSMDLYINDHQELCYQDVYCYNSYKLFFSNHCHNCVESYFLYDCRHCQNCFGCANLRNKKYYIFNKSYTKQEYLKKMKEFDLGSYENLLKQKKNYQDRYKKAIHKFAQINKSVNCTGDEIENSKNCFYSFDILKNVEDSKFVNWGGYGCKDAYDVGPGFGMCELFYEVVDSGLESAKNFFTNVLWRSNNIQYAINCHSCSYCFGCVGLRHKKYCILNKQYSKEEYFKMLEKIKNHMSEMPYKDKKGRVYKYGEFFPIEFSPFGYNETIAQQHFSLIKGQIIEQGYNWHEKPKSEYQPTIKAKDLPDHIKGMDDSILKEVVECKNSNCAGVGVFKLVPREIKFYQKMNLPLPRLCFDCRHRERIKQRNPLKLWHRQCMKQGCSTEFETSYSPERKEIVYCEQCYNKEVG